MQLYSGSNNPKLAQKIAKKLNLTLGKVSISKFPNGEIKLWVSQENIDKRVIIVQSFSPKPNQAIIEFCLMVDALKRNGVSEIIAVIPWMGYCVQDKVFRSGEPLSAKVIANIIQNTKVNKIITIDLHNETIQGFFDTNLSHLSAIPIFIEYFKNKDFDCLLAPDVGALKENSKIAQQLNLPIVVINKRRDLYSGETKIISIEGKIKGKKILIIDDFISTGSTLLQATQYLVSQKVKEINIAVTHNLFVPGAMKKLLSSPLNHLFYTDSINQPSTVERINNYKQKVKIISLDDQISKEIFKYI